MRAVGRVAADHACAVGFQATAATPNVEATVANNACTHAVVASAILLSFAAGVGAVGTPENTGDESGANDAARIFQFVAENVAPDVNEVNATARSPDGVITGCPAW